MRLGRNVLLASWLVSLCGGAMAHTLKPPRSVEAIAVSTTEIRVYWLPAQGATGYRVRRDGQEIATLPATAQEFADTGLAPDSAHRYVVTAIRESQEASAPEYVERTFAPFPEENLSGNQETGRKNRSRAQLPTVDYDVVVVQASSGGSAAAIEAARRGLRTALIEPTTRLGGMPVNNLSATDLRRPEHASGFFVRFRDRVRDLYSAEGIKSNGLQYEPRIAHQAMKSLLYAVPNLTIFRRVRLARVLTRPAEDPPASTNASALYTDPFPHFPISSFPSSKVRKRVEAIEVEELGADDQPTGKRALFRAGVFIDATDCGDLAAWAGAPFRVGREPRSKREPHAGVIYYDRAHDKLLPGSTGEGDRRLMSYAYLLAVKDYGPGADRTIPRPPGYRKEDFAHAPAWKESWAVTSGRMPNGKYELNQHPQGNDLQAVNYGYPTAGYAERARIETLYRNHVLGYLYYIQTEQGQKQIGLPDDEYRDSGGFPPLLYVREGRRILGEQAPEEADITEARQFTRPESVGLGDYPMDSHAVRPKTDWTTPDMGEGEWWLYQVTPWHQLPLGILIPRELDNVFVTTAVSSTHVSFGTYRLEPVRMAFGEAAGIAAALCLRYHLAARDVPARQVQDEMLPHAANPFGDEQIYLSYLADVKPGGRHYRAIQYLVSRGFALSAEALKPDAPTTRGELARWLAQLAARSAPPPKILEHTHEDGQEVTRVRRAYYPVMGDPADRNAPADLARLPDQDAVVTRAEVATWLLLTLPPARGSEVPNDVPHYADVFEPAVRANAEALYARGLDSRLWDGWEAYAPDGKLFFKPEAPLRHADLLEALYIAQIGLGPLFLDIPADGRNGWHVPPPVFETVVQLRP